VAKIADSIDAAPESYSTESPTEATRAPRAVEKAIRGMLPKNSLGRAQLKKLKVYAGPEHPHAAQQPKPYTLTQVAQ
jgi:ribosomal protein L13